MIQGVIMKVIYLLCAYLLTISAYASKVSVELNDEDYSETPANDLVHQGVRIDKYEALELKQRGIDLSTLSVRQSTLYSGGHLPSLTHANFPSKSDILDFEEYKTSPSEIFRSVVSLNGSRYVLTAGLDNHFNIIRARVLRLLGYDVDLPKFYKTLNVRFESTEKQKEFLEVLGEQTLTKRDKWKSEKSSDEVLILKSVTLEPAALRNVNLYLPVMNRTRQEDKRVYRAMLNLYLATDFPQSINKASWAVGREFNNTLIFNHAYASDFANITIDDMRWMQRKLNSLGRDQYKDAFASSGMPMDIQALAMEKFLSRLNYLSELLRLPKAFQIDQKLSKGNVINGELVKDDYQDYVVEFFEDDELSPYRFSELAKFFRTQAIYTSLGNLLDQANEKLLPGIRLDDAMKTIQEKIASARSNNMDGNSIKAFTSPTAAGRVFANRNVVFGQFMGTQAPITLVDTVGAEANLGTFSSITGLLDQAMPSLSFGVSVGRTYTHARAMPDLEAATSQSIKNLLIPILFKSLGRVIKDEYTCGIETQPFVEESTLRDQKIYYVKYDPKWEDAKARAIEKRQELIDSGVKETVMLVQIDRDQLCGDEVVSTKRAHLKEFVEQFAHNEMFVVNDLIRVEGRVNAPIPLGVDRLNLNLGADGGYGVLKSTVIRKTEQGLEITIQAQRDMTKGASQGLSYYIDLISHSNKWTDGKLYSKVYKVDLEGISDEQLDSTLSLLRSLIVHNDFTRLKSDFSPIELDHTVAASLDTFKFFTFKSEEVEMEHEVEVIAPNPEGKDYSLEQRTRKLYSARDLRRDGSDYLTVIDRILGTTSNFLGIGTGNNDPGKTFYGNSEKVYVTTEIDLQNEEFDPVLKIDRIISGWNASAEDMLLKLQDLEDDFASHIEAPMISKSILTGTTRIKSYDARTSTIIYPQGIEAMLEFLKQDDHIAMLYKLKEMYGDRRWEQYCKRAKRFFGDQGPHNYRFKEFIVDCVPRHAKSLLSLTKIEELETKHQRTNLVNKTFAILFNEFKVDNVLKIIGKENFFASARVTGFRENHHQGQLEYISNSIGTYNLEHGTGVFDDVASKLGISAYELKAFMYTPGM